MQHIDHFTLRSSRLEATRDFFVQVAGLVVGPRPAFRFPGYWLYLDGRPVVHLAGPSPGRGLDDYLGARGAATAGGAVDHIAFRGSGLPTFEQRLRTLGKPYRGRTVPDLREHQVFVEDPNGVVVEFIFDADETASWQAGAAGIAAPASAP